MDQSDKWKFYDIDREKDLGVVTSIAYFVVVATLKNADMYEIVRVGVQQLIGEIVRVDYETVSIWMYENISGLQVGDPVVRTGQPLSIELGPGLLGHMYDGLQRPFQEMSDGGTNPFLTRGINLPALDRHKQWEFIPQNFKIGDHIAGGDVFGKVYETSLVVHWIMLPPKAAGTITYIAPTGHYTVVEEVLTIESKESGSIQSFAMMHKWIARAPRPFVEKRKSYTPLYTGLRTIDALFPMAQGGTCVIPGAFGTGKGTICHNIAKYSNSDIVVYVNCGERGNELADMVMDFSSAEIELRGAKHDIMKRTCILGNPSNMPIGAREPCIITGTTISEYFRDQGYHTTLILDSISRWAELLTMSVYCPSRYPSPHNLAVRMARIYECAGNVLCQASSAREGSLSIVGTLSPPGGDMGEPVLSAALSISQAMWLLDKKLAQRRSFPAVSWSISHSRYARDLVSFYADFDANYDVILGKFKDILMTDNDLSEIIQLVGIDSLEESDKLLVKVAELIKESFMEQDIATKEEQESPYYKTVWMMKNIVAFHELAKLMLEDMPLRDLLDYTGPVWRALRNMKYEDPAKGRAAVEKNLKKIYQMIMSLL